MGNINKFIKKKENINKKNLKKLVNHNNTSKKQNYKQKPQQKHKQKHKNID
jgi:hypothetical protein